MRRSETVFIHLNPLLNVIIQLAVSRITAVECNSLLYIHLGVEVATLPVENDCEVEISLIKLGV